MSRAWVFSELEEMDYPKLGLAKLEFDFKTGLSAPRFLCILPSVY
jgi:hypothetical protein